MTDRPDASTRKRLEQEAREQERREWDERLPMAPEQHERLLDHLDARLKQTGCDCEVRDNLDPELNVI